MNSPRSLDVRGLAVDLAGRTVLHDVEIHVGHAEIVGLIGPNGAGKTTLLRSVLGLIPIREGVIKVDGRQATDRRGSIGYVPQRHEFAWDFPISIRKAVLSGLAHRVGWFGRAKAEHLEAVDEAIERVDLTRLRDRPVGELSGGQRQRVLVARALALRTRLLLLDEPFTGLDVPTQNLLTSLFDRLRSEGQALLMTTHDLNAAGELCDRLCLVNRTIVATGNIDVLRDPVLWMRAFGPSRSVEVTA